MVETEVADASITRSITVATVVGFAAVVWVAYWCDRTYRRWLRENHPLAGQRARLVRLNTGYREKRANATEAAQIISDVLVEIARARST
jgi:hypothetical protein